MIGGATLLALGLAMGGCVAPADAANPLPALALLAYMGFISAAAYSLWSMALAANPVSRVAVFGFMNPVFGAVLSALLLGETSVVSPVLAVVALALVSTGIIVVNRWGKNDTKGQSLRVISLILAHGRVNRIESLMKMTGTSRLA